MMSVLLLSFGVSWVQMTYARPVCGAAAPIPGQVRLGVDRAVRLSRDVVEAADVLWGRHRGALKPAGSEAVGVDRRVDVGAGLAALLVLVGDHHLAVRADRGVAVAAAPSGGNGLGRAEGPELPSPVTGAPTPGLAFRDSSCS